MTLQKDSSILTQLTALVTADNWEGLILNLLWICFCDFNLYFAAFIVIVVCLREIT